jgi:hypothetical protein|tara:strand:- start:580 stop:885 length:306 start_codon:yes stop_codon:yes gene_type:complete
MKLLKFRKAASSVVDADEAYYLPSDEIKFIETEATKIKVYLLGRGADVNEDDYIYIEGITAGKELTYADDLAKSIVNHRDAIVTIDLDYSQGCTDITYTAA